ncbi:IlvD/Edd family dehydratase [Pacificibacter marinus]|uniref:IlvD/Edd family dehydratase n=1 Tax=Pacificibacter marinus TaxID=658057 RepID=UPI001C07680E|nr:IlvD/Edd family dehydratase [Pacificibacter marinus]MBU2868424.1 dihydroxy-acid dehydratase family protein [Pacificibacter marinus]
MKLRSQQWFDNPENPGMTAMYLERYLNYGLTREELQSGKPIIGIAQTGNDLTPCNRHHVELAKRVRDGITASGGICFEFPVHPIQETGKRPTAGLDRNLAYLGLVETLYGYPLDGVVLTIGCDKTTPALLMAAATVNIPAIALSVGPMLNGWEGEQRMGSGTVIWDARKDLAVGEIDEERFMQKVSDAAPSVGYCNSMGTASTMNCLTEALGMQMPGSGAIPAPYRERGQMAYRTGKRIVDMVHEDLKPSDIMTRGAFENAIVVNSAIGGSTNAPIHLNAVASHMGVKLDNDDWERLGHTVPLIVDMQPSGKYLAEDFHRAGGIAAVISCLLSNNVLPDRTALCATGQTMEDVYVDVPVTNTDVIRPFDTPLKPQAGFLNLTGNLWDSAIMKTSVISEGFRARYLSAPDDPEAFEGRAIVFDGPEHYHATLDDPALEIDETCILVMRGAGPIGYPGGAEVVNMQPPATLIAQGITELPCIGDGRQSGTSGSPSILNVAPEAAAMGGLAILQTNDILRVDLAKRRVDVLISDEILDQRRSELRETGNFPYPADQTPWQQIQRGLINQFDKGAVLSHAPDFQRIAQTKGIPRDNH